MWLWPDRIERTAALCIDADRRWATRVQAAAGPTAIAGLIVVSRLGDGVVWYATMLALPLLDGDAGWRCSMQMLGLGGLNLIVYLGLKHGVGRPRPYVDCPGIRACTPPLDRFSFPSGHTLHAVAYALVIAGHYPFLGLALWTFALLVAASRVALGLHYPSDVLAGAGIGAGTASAVLAFP